MHAQVSSQPELQQQLQQSQAQAQAAVSKAQAASQGLNAASQEAARMADAYRSTCCSLLQLHMLLFVTGPMLHFVTDPLAALCHRSVNHASLATVLTWTYEGMLTHPTQRLSSSSAWTVLLNCLEELNMACPTVIVAQQQHW